MATCKDCIIYEKCGGSLTNNLVPCDLFKNKADVVSQKAYEQVKWERDTAIEQLKSYGVGFCENADVVKVKQGEWIKFTLGDFDFVERYKCSECETDIVPFPNYISSFLYCFNCGAKMDGERKCDNG